MHPAIGPSAEARIYRVVQLLMEKVALGSPSSSGPAIRVYNRVCDEVNRRTEPVQFLLVQVLLDLLVMDTRDRH